MRRNRSRKCEALAERLADLGDVQTFVASLKDVIAMQVYEEERESVRRNIKIVMDTMDVRECYVALRSCKRPR